VPGGQDPSGRATSERLPLGRLTKRPEFLAAATGRRFHTERVTVQGRRRDASPDEPAVAAEGLRVGLTITKRVGHATERNRIRRRLRVAIREAAGAGFADLPLDIVLVGRRDALSASFPQLVGDLKRALPAVLRPKSSSARPARGATSPSPAGGSHGSHIGHEPEPAETGRPSTSSPPRDAPRSRTNPRHD
jgi:ribonuclease P protein component